MTFSLQAHPRFEIRRRIGQGASGTVFAAWDRIRSEVVALKALHQRDPGAIYRFKKEFRLLAEVVHPNLVSLYELFVEGEQLFFTMELVDGEDFLTWVHCAEAVSEAETLTDAPQFDPVRLNSALRQLALGLRTLHATDRVHCDLKPTNVLVTPRGRVVILDFGVGRHFGAMATEESAQEGLTGTIHYMAPEQAKGEAPLPANDWYAVGVMLYQALTGRLPYEGATAVQILYQKVHQEPLSPEELIPDLPENLVDLCRELLVIDPQGRIGGDDIETRLTGSATSKLSSNDSSHPSPNDPENDTDHVTEQSELALIGRDRELEVLRRAFDDCREGRVRALWIHGESGMGKSSFLRGAWQSFRRDDDAVILTGRCFDRELMPYKALDGVLDSLTRFLRTLSPNEVEVYLPRGLHALTRIFPSLLRVDAIERAVRDDHAGPDELALRRRAFAAVRELFERLAHRRPLIVHIDDLQWADADSMTLLEELLRPPDPPPFLLVASFRSEEIERRDFLREMIDRSDGERRKVLRLDPLAEKDSETLVRALLGPDAPEGWIRRIVVEAQGSPFFIEQLVGFARDLPAASDPAISGELTQDIDFKTTLAARLQQLPAGCDEILQILAVAGRPIDAASALRAAGLDGDLKSRLTALRAAKLVSVRGSAGQVELYHGRIREVIRNRLSKAENKVLHARLAEVLKDREDPEMLYEHLYRSGDLRAAAEQAAGAADRARQSLAFDRAARLYRQALDLGYPDTEDRLVLQRHLAESLANAGRPRHAAEAFLEAAEMADSSEALSLRRSAAHEFLAGGYIDEGWQLTLDVCQDVGLRVATNRPAAIVSLLWNRLKLRLRGLEFKHREEERLAREELLRIDTSWSMAMALANIQPLYGADLQVRHLLRSLRAGEPRRIARAMAMEASYQGLTANGETSPMGPRALNIARSTEDPVTLGTAVLHLGISDYLVGHWRSASVRCEEARNLFTDQCTGVLWELSSAKRFMTLSLIPLGEIDRLRSLGEADLAEAMERGDVQLATFLRNRMVLVRLADNDPDRARREVEASQDFLSRLPFIVLHISAFFARLDLETYAGETDAAWRIYQEQWPTIRRAPLMRISMLRCETFFTVGRTALAKAAADGSHSGSEACNLAADFAAKLAKEKLPCAALYADILRAGVAVRRGERHVAESLLEEAAINAERLDMRAFRAAIRLQRARLTQSAIPRETEQWFAEEGVKRPEAFADLLVPVLSRPRSSPAP